jgi:hypothetical protein
MPGAVTETHPADRRTARDAGDADELSGPDRAALRELVEAYALAADSGDPAAVAALFTPGGRLVVHHDPDRPEPTGVRTGREEITAAIATLGRFRATTHLVGAHRARRVGGRATGETTGMAYQLLVDEEHTTLEVLGIRYLDEYALVDGAWRFEERHVIVRWREVREQ